MKHLQNYINEKLIITKDKAKNKYAYSCQPQKWGDLRNILEDRLEKDKDADLNDIDVTKITDMSDIFRTLDPHNIDISEWDVSNVTNTEGMFYGCKNFNSDLSNWDVSNVKYMFRMFSNCQKFDSDLSNWDVSNVEDMKNIFDGCYALKHVPTWYLNHFK